MFDLITMDAMTALLQVILIDLVLAGDNAIVIGLAAAGLPPEQRAKAIIIVSVRCEPPTCRKKFVKSFAH